MSSPYWRMRGGSPAMKCRSEPRRSRISLRNASMAATGGPSALRSGRRGRGGVRLRQHAGVGHEFLEGPLVRGIVVRIVRINLARIDGREQGHVEILHAEIATGLQLARDLVRLIALNQLGDGL